MPHRVGGLFKQIITRENIVGAWEDYNRNRPVYRRREIDEPEVDSILAELETWHFNFGKPREKDIWEGGKIRHLKIPSFRSTIAQTAIFRVLNPEIDKRLPEMSMSSRKGKGGHLLAKKVKRFVRTHKKDAKFVLYFDIKKFYDHINLDDALAALERVFKEPVILSLVREIFEPCGKGLPIGYIGAHQIANLIGARIFRRLRSMKGITYGCVYMDNFHFFARSRAPLHRLRKEAVKVLAEFGMTMKKDWQIYPTAKRGVRIAGQSIKASGMTQLYPRINRNMHRAFKRAFNNPTEHNLASAMSYVGWLKSVNRIHILLDLIKEEKQKCRLILLPLLVPMS